MRKLPLILGALLLSAMFASELCGAGLAPPTATAATPSGLTLTLVTGNTYALGQTIQISGTVKDNANNPISGGTVTIQLSCAGTGWDQRLATQISSNGAYSTSYQISYGNPAGTWSIAATAVDNSGNSGENSKNVTVTTPGNVVYLIQLSPVENSTKRRGDNVLISAKVTSDGTPNGTNVDDATVSSNTPTGENIALTKIAPGTYSATYTVKWNDPTENWSISVEATKAAENKAWGAWLNVKIAAAALGVSLQSPTKSKFEVGESVEVKVAVTYPSGENVENATVSANTPRGGTLPLAPHGSGVYSATYATTSEDVGTWSMTVGATDNYGNSGEGRGRVDITLPEVPSFFAKYWWAILAVLLGIGTAAAYVGRQKLLVGKLEAIKRENEGIPRLKKDAGMKYLKDGSISRDAYNTLIKKYDARMDELKKKEIELRAKLKKKPKK